MNAQLLQWLKETGLDEQRASVYLQTLSLGEATAKELSDQVGMSRTAIYDNLRVLEERGYIHVMHQGKRKVFVPLHPKELYKKFNQQRQQLKDLLPDFLAMFAEGSHQPFVQMFTGQHAAREVFEDILSVTKKEYTYFSPPNITYTMVEKKYIKEWVKRRVEKGIHSKSLRVKEREMLREPVFTQEKEYLRQIRYLPAYVDLKASIYMYENNIGIISTKKEAATCIIHSPDLAFSFKQIFQFLWGISK